MKQQTETIIKKKNMSWSSIKKQENIFCFLMLITFIVYWLVFWLYANFSSIELAFTEYDPYLDVHSLLPSDKLFTNFGNFINDVFSLKTSYLANGALMHLISTLVCLPTSYIFSFMICKKCTGSGFFKVMMYLPAILSGMVVTLLYKHFIEGAIFEFIKLNLGQELFFFSDARYNWSVVIIYLVYFGMPGSLLINLGTMSRIPQDLIEYGELEGLSLFQEFIYVTIPFVFPMLQVQCLGLFTGFFTTQGPLYSLYEGGAPENLKTFGYFMFTSIYGAENPGTMYGYTSAANLTIGLVSVPIVQATKWLFDKIDPGAEL